MCPTLKANRDISVSAYPSFALKLSIKSLLMCIQQKNQGSG